MGWSNCAGYYNYKKTDNSIVSSSYSIWLIYEPNGNYLNFSIASEENYNNSKINAFLNMAPYEFSLTALR